MSAEEITKETTLENAVLTRRRRDGNTTRLIDNAIRILFEGKVCVCLDHHEMGDNKIENKRLFESVLRRLNLEHPWLFSDKSVYFDKSKLEISLRPKNGILKSNLYQ